MNRIDRINEEEIDLKDLIDLLKRNKLLIFLMIVLFGAGTLIFLYFTTPQYKTYGTVEISSNKPSIVSRDDLLMQAIDLYTGPNDVDTEMEILRSRSIIQQTLKRVDYTKRYYVVRNFKSIEVLDREFPFNIEIRKGKGIEFVIKPEGSGEYVLEAKWKREGKEREVKIKSKYGEWVKTPEFEIKVDKKAGMKAEGEYKFVWEDSVRVASKLQQRLKVGPVSQKASILKVTFNDNIPQRAAEFVNELMRVYITESIKNKTKQADKTLEFIDSQLKTVSKKLAESEIALENYKKRHKVINLGLEAQNLMQKLNELQTKLNEIKLQESLINFIERQIKDSKTSSLISANVLDDKVLGELITQLQQLMLKKKDLLIEYTPKHPDVIKVEEQINVLKKMIINRIKNIRGVLESNKKNLEKMIKEYTRMLERLPQNERRLIDLKRKYMVNEKIYSYLLEKRAATAIAKSSIISDNRIVDTAIVPEEPFKPRKKLILAIGLILGFIAGVLLALIKEFLSTKIKTVEDIERLTDVPIIGTVPHFKSTKNILKVFESPKSVVAEAFRVIRMNIRFLSPKRTEIITVTSTISGEGKTTIASNVAGIYALGGKRTVIVNVDLRKPALHKVFGIKNDVGLSNVLVGEKSIEEVIHTTTHDNLYVIPSGPIPPNPGELIQSDKMNEVIDYLKDEFEIVVFDTPPVGMVVDAISILTRADVNIYIFRANYSKKMFVRTLNDLKYNKKIKGLGIVVNDIKDKDFGYGYGYGYGYGKGYYGE